MKLKIKFIRTILKLNKNRSKHEIVFPSILIQLENTPIVFPSILIQLENGPNEFYSYFPN